MVAPRCREVRDPASGESLPAARARGKASLVGQPDGQCHRCRYRFVRGRTADFPRVRAYDGARRIVRLWTGHEACQRGLERNPVAVLLNVGALLPSFKVRLIKAIKDAAPPGQRRAPVEFVAVSATDADLDDSERRDQPRVEA